MQIRRRQRTRDVLPPLEAPQPPSFTRLLRPVTVRIAFRRGSVMVGAARQPTGPVLGPAGTIWPRVLRPVLSQVPRLRGRVTLGGFGPETEAPPAPPPSVRKPKWFPGLNRKYRRF